MKTITKLMIIFLFLFAILGDFIVGVFGIGSIRLISLVGFVLFFGGYLILKQDNRLYKILFSIFTLVVFYIVVRGGLFKGFTAIYCIPLGYLIAKEWKYCSPYLDVIFCVQLVLLIYETLTHSYIFHEVSGGIIEAYSNNFDADVMEDIAQHVGFRTKGLFGGTLTASSFVIYYSYLNKDNRLKLFLCLLMAFLIKGRLAILSVFLLFAYDYYKVLKKKYSKRSLIMATFAGGFLLFLIILLLSSYAASVPFVYNLLHAFDPDAAGNFGRIWAYTQAYDTYVNNYGIIQKLFGGDYELLDQYGRTGVSAESEFLGQLLEIGIVGVSLYIVAFVILFRQSRNSGVSIKFVALMTLMAYLEYRHCSGNMRAMFFWTVFFLYTKYYTEYERVTQRKAILKQNQRKIGTQEVAVN